MIEPEVLVATCDADGQILSRNEAWAHVLGKETDLWIRLDENDRETARRNFEEAARGSLVTHALFMASRPERDIPVPILLHFVPVCLEKGAKSGADAVCITGEVLAEPSSWTESQTERHRMETLGRMTMGMAHDFNNLLAGIMGHLELWHAEAEADDAGLEHVRTIERAARDGADLIGRVQRYIRQERRQDYESIDLKALVADCIRFTRPYWYNEPRRQGISIDFSHQMDVLPAVSGSPSEIRDVVVNLILNAVHALPDGGTISARAEADDRYVHIRITDDGVGMPATVADHIFEPLYTTKGEQGTGMGLAVAAGVMREHGGFITVESEPGKGSTFTLAFLIMHEENDASAVTDSSMTGAGSARVLVVDDEPMVRNVVERLLSLRGHTVISAGSGREALDLMKE
ncbi:MAG: hypothetical protein HKN17_02355, partial [Rhodothermales bacterium]|nr:hypothetical protein [Rhodothermales bacterium]